MNPNDDSAFDIPVRGRQSEDRSMPEFHPHAVLVKKARLPDEIDEYENQDYVRIINPGSRDVVDRAVKEADKERWPRQWAAYQAGKEQVADGYPLDKCGWIDPASLKMCKSVHVHTIEQLADLPDNAVRKLGPGGMKLKQHACQWLKDNESRQSLIDKLERYERGEAPEGKPVAAKKLKEEVRHLKDALAERDKLIADLQAQISMLKDGHNPDGVKHEAA